jgi:hypothetical protein
MEPAWTAFSRAGLTPIRGGVRAVSAFEVDTGLLNRHDWRPARRLQASGRAARAWRTRRAELRHLVESALGEHSLGGGAFCPSLYTRVDLLAGAHLGSPCH